MQRREAACDQGLVAGRNLYRSGAGVGGIGYLDRAVVDRHLGEPAAILVFLAFLGVSRGVIFGATRRGDRVGRMHLEIWRWRRRERYERSHHARKQAEFSVA